MRPFHRKFYLLDVGFLFAVSLFTVAICVCSFATAARGAEKLRLIVMTDSYIDTYVNVLRHGNLPYLQMQTRRAFEAPAVQTAVRASPKAAPRFPLHNGLFDLSSIELSFPVDVGSVRYAHLANINFTFETIIIHDRCQYTRAQSQMI